jgi:hypothetical protein
MRGYIVRLAGYLVLLGIAARVAQALWTSRGLDGVATLQPFHDAGLVALLAAPFVLALIGVGRARALAVFVACSLAGAAITAPFVCGVAAGV